MQKVTLYDFMYMKCPEKGKFIETKADEELLWQSAFRDPCFHCRAQVCFPASWETKAPHAKNKPETGRQVTGLRMRTVLTIYTLEELFW